MKTLQLLLLLLATTLTSAQTINFPESHAGVWKGILEINGASGMRSVPMELHIAPTHTAGRWVWKTIYDNKDVRDYELVEIDKSKGKYQIDEKNGIMLDFRLFGNKSFTCFEVEGYLLYDMYTFNESSIVFELTSSMPQQVSKSGKGGKESPVVTSYPQVAYQRAILTKAN